MKTIAQHWFRRPNVGDQNCSPASYFDFSGLSVVDVHDEVDWRGADLAIFGGGSWPKRMRKRAKAARWARLRVAWAVGHTVRGEYGPMPQTAHHKSIPLFEIFTQRDWGLDGRWVPCVSAMSEHFEDPPEPEHSTVFFGHPQDGPLAGVRGPKMMNDELDFGKVIRFLASGETVVTASYHGAYWATLLGRKVVAVPYSRKFWHLKYAPQLIEDHRTWSTAARKATSYGSEPLEEARHLNRSLYTEVMERLHD
jgi:hypothetical protein